MMTTSPTTPRFVEPMLCLPVHVLPVGDDWSYEVKWDGYRAIGSKQGTDSRLFSRTGRSLDREFPQLTEQLSHLRCRSAIVDGEIVAWNDEGKPSYQLLQQRGRIRSVTFMLFDLMMLNGRDLTHKPLSFRRRALSSIMPKGDVSLLSFSETLCTPTNALMDRAGDMRLEGIIAKRGDSLYEPGQRSGAWVKCRAEMRGSFLIGGYIPSANPDEFEELILGQVRQGHLHFVARLREGFEPGTARTIRQAIRPLTQPGCPFADLPEKPSTGSQWGQSLLDADTMHRCHWVAPRGSVEVAFSQWTSDRKLQQPRFSGLVRH